MRGEEERIDRHEDYVVVVMDHQRRTLDLAKHRKTVLLGNETPLADGSQLSDGRLLGYRSIAVTNTQLKPLDISASGGLTRLALSKECLHKQANFVVPLV